MTHPQRRDDDEGGDNDRAAAVDDSWDAFLAAEREAYIDIAGAIIGRDTAARIADERLAGIRDAPGGPPH